MYVVEFLIDETPAKLFNTFDEAKDAAIAYLDEYGFDVDAFDMLDESADDLTFEGFAVEDVVLCFYAELA